MSTQNSFILKMNDRDTIRFVELYEGEPVLWNYLHPKYNKRDAREAAAERVAVQLGIDNFTSKHVLVKFKNLRSSYLQEVKKIKKSLTSGDGVYMPRVVWFPIMDRFLKPHVKSRNSDWNDTQVHDKQNMDTQTTQDKQRQDSRDSCVNLDLDDNQEVEQRVTRDSDNLLNDSTLFKRKMLETARTFSHSSLPNSWTSSTRKKSREAPSHVLDSMLKKLDDIATRVQTSLTNKDREDHLDHYGKYVGSMLRNLPDSVAFPLQQKITDILIQAHMSVTVPPDTPIVEDATSDSFSNHYESRSSPSNFATTTDGTLDSSLDPIKCEDTPMLYSPYMDESEIY